jgi:hypothetical protein
VVPASTAHTTVRAVCPLGPHKGPKGKVAALSVKHKSAIGHDLLQYGYALRIGCEGITGLLARSATAFKFGREES